MTGNAAIGTLGMSVLIGLVVFTFIIMPLYVLASLGLMDIAKKHGVGNEWAAWIPFYNSYLLGKIAINEKVGVAMLVLGLITFVDRMMALVPSPLAIIAMVSFIILTLFTLHKTYEKMSSKCVIMSVATVLSFGILFPIFLFTIRKNELLEECAIVEAAIAEAEEEIEEVEEITGELEEL